MRVESGDTLGSKRARRSANKPLAGCSGKRQETWRAVDDESDAAPVRMVGRLC